MMKANINLSLKTLVVSLLFMVIAFMSSMYVGEYFANRKIHFQFLASFVANKVLSDVQSNYVMLQKLDSYNLTEFKEYHSLKLLEILINAESKKDAVYLNNSKYCNQIAVIKAEIDSEVQLGENSKFLKKYIGAFFCRKNELGVDKN